MRITTLLIALLVAAYFIQGFAPVKCEHVFVEVEEPTVVVEPAHQVNNVYVMPPTGKHEGKPLICVKCFHIQKQILDYGKPAMSGSTLGSLIWPQSSQINAGPCYDSIFTRSAGGYLKVDSMPVPVNIIARKGKAVFCLDGPDSLDHDWGVYWYSDSNKALFDSVKKWTHETGVHYFTDSERHRAKNSKKKIN